MKGFSFGDKNYKYAIIIFVLSFLVYGNSIQNKYSLDDHLVNDQNELTQHGIKNFKQIFSSYSFKEKDFNYEYRPVLLLSFAIEYQIFGVNPHISHFISVLLFSLFVILLFNFLRKAFPESQPLVILFGIVLFIVHPIHTEVVDNIKSRDELLTSVFGICLLLQFKKYLSDKKIYRLFLTAIFAGLGFLTKESIVIFIALIPFLFLMNPSESKFDFKKVLIPLVLITIAFIGIRLGKSHFLKSEIHNRVMEYYENPLSFEKFPARIPAGLSISLVYLRLLIWPFVLSFYYGFNEIPIDTWTSFLPYVSLVFHAFLIYLAIKFFNKDKLFSFSLIIYLIGIFAASGIVKLIPGIVGERFMFFGSAGFTMLIAIFLFKFFRKWNWIEFGKTKLKFKPNAIIISIILILILGISSFSRNSVWENEDTLILSDAEHLQNSAKVQDMASFRTMIKIYSKPDSPERNKLIKQAEDHCLQCLDVYPKHINCLNNLGTLYFIEQNYSESKKYYQRALQIDSSDANVLFNIATIYQKLNDAEKANYYYEKAITSNPDLPNLIPFYKQFVVQNKRQVEAIAFISKILCNFPSDYELNLLIIDLYDDQHDYNSALKYLNKAYHIKPSKELAKFMENINKLNKK